MLLLCKTIRWRPAPPRPAPSCSGSHAAPAVAARPPGLARLQTRCWSYWSHSLWWEHAAGKEGELVNDAGRGGIGEVRWADAGGAPRPRAGGAGHAAGGQGAHCAAVSPVAQFFYRTRGSSKRVGACVCEEKGRIVEFPLQRFCCSRGLDTLTTTSQTPEAQQRAPRGYHDGWEILFPGVRRGGEHTVPYIGGAPRRL
jgi:hypothetical protein